MKPKTPRRVRPKFPSEWHVPETAGRWITWEHARRSLLREKIYWLSTTRHDGRPHAVPLWGLWHDGAFFFESDPRSVKGRNMEKNPGVVVHIQDGYDTVILEGNSTRETRRKLLQVLQRGYKTKYDYSPDWSRPGSQVVYKVEPRRILAWKNPHMHRSMVNFVF